MEEKIFLQEETSNIDINKLVSFCDYPFDAFEKGKQFEDMVGDVLERGIVQPIIVRSLENNKYEILDGHYRVATAKKLNWGTIPAFIFENLDDEEAFNYVSDIHPVGLLKKHGIDIYDKNYKKSDAYKELENARVVLKDDYGIFLDEYIECFLLTDEERQGYFESIYDLGNSYTLSEAECEYNIIANEIVQKLILGEKQENMFEIESQNRCSKDIRMEKVEIRFWKEEEKENTTVVVRQIKDYNRQLRKYLNIDMDLFDYNIIQNKRDRAKLYYYLYKIKHKEFKKFNILELLRKPSMENIDNSFWGYNTNNGKTMGMLKRKIVREVAIDIRRKIEETVRGIVDEWGSSIWKIRNRMEYMPDQDNSCADKIKILKSKMNEEFIREKTIENNTIMSLPLFGLFYLRLVQHEYLGQVNDLLMLYDYQNDIEYDVPEKYIIKMKEIETKTIFMEDLDTYFQADNVRKIAELVYLKPQTNKEERRKIVSCKEKVRRFSEFCKLYGNNSEIDFTELLVVSCLQEIILGRKREAFDYRYYGYEGNSKERKNKRSVQNALANDEPTCDALQIYWINKVVNRSYANVGRLVFQKNSRELEKLTCNILAQILSCTTLDEMLSMDAFYKNMMIEYGHLL